MVAGLEAGRVRLRHPWSGDGALAYAFAGRSDLAQLYLRSGGGAPRRLTDLNTEVLKGVAIAPVESFTFASNDFKYEVEAFLTMPIGLREGTKHPLIVMIHGGPHGQQGPLFVFKSQYYAHRGWATLQVNFRGSTGYGQAFADAVFGDQNGNEAQDVLYGVSATLRRNPWIDRDRVGIEGGSYGGQLTCWVGDAPAPGQLDGRAVGTLRLETRRQAVMVRYPSEGHGLAEPKHAVDLMDRSVMWYEKHFGRAAGR